MLATISNIQCREIIRNTNRLNYISGGIQFNKYGKGFDLNFFSYSFGMSNFTLNFNDFKDISVYRKECLETFESFLEENNNDQDDGQTKSKISAELDSQDVYIKFLDLITSNEVFSNKFDKCLKDIKFNSFLSDSTNNSSNQFRKLDLLEYDAKIYKQHNVDEFLKKAEKCEKLVSSKNINIDLSNLGKVDYSVFYDTKLADELINDGNPIQSNSSSKNPAVDNHPAAATSSTHQQSIGKPLSAENVVQQPDPNDPNSPGDATQQPPLSPSSDTKVTSDGLVNNSSAVIPPTKVPPTPMPRSRKNIMNTENFTSKLPPIPEEKEEEAEDKNIKNDTNSG